MIQINSTLYAVWSSNRTGDWNIYFDTLQSDLYSPLGPDSDPSTLIEGIVPFFLLFTLISAIILTFSLIKNQLMGEKEFTKDKTFNFRLISSVFFLFGTIAFKPSIRRLSVTKVEDNTVRNQILQILQDRDFIHFRELKRYTQTGTAHLRWHLEVLKEFEYIKQKTYSQYVIYYLRNKTPNTVYINVYFSLFSTTAFLIAMAFIRTGIWRFDNLVRFVQQPKRKINYHCNKLIKDGILIKNEHGYLSLNSEYSDWVDRVVSQRKLKFA